MLQMHSHATMITRHAPRCRGRVSPHGGYLNHARRAQLDEGAASASDPEEDLEAEREPGAGKAMRHNPCFGWVGIAPKASRAMSSCQGRSGFPIELHVSASEPDAGPRQPCFRSMVQFVDPRLGFVVGAMAGMGCHDGWSVHETIKRPHAPVSLVGYGLARVSCYVGLAAEGRVG